jgi:hypothetical protein
MSVASIALTRIVYLRNIFQYSSDRLVQFYIQRRVHSMWADTIESHSLDIFANIVNFMLEFAIREKSKLPVIHYAEMIRRGLKHQLIGTPSEYFSRFMRAGYESDILNLFFGHSPIIKEDERHFPTLVISVIHRRDNRILRQLLDFKIDVNKKPTHGSGRTYVWHAITEGNLEALEMLLKEGANLVSPYKPAESEQRLLLENKTIMEIIVKYEIT